MYNWMVIILISLNDIFVLYKIKITYTKKFERGGTAPWIRPCKLCYTLADLFFTIGFKIYCVLIDCVESVIWLISLA